MNGLRNLAEVMETGNRDNEVFIDEDIRIKALLPIRKMMDFARGIS